MRGGALLLAALLLPVSLRVGSYPVPAPDVTRALSCGTGGRLAVHFADQERLARAAEAAAPPNVTMTRMALVAARC
ncbi:MULTISPECIES: hypothetical protein [Streptomyces]|uniref:hypothetical protein n=1 Tax=Streptomyces TaxID=1883 RepID=UPI00204844BA|nr:MULTISPECIES: hypothetical protein [Streptomyces]UPT47318.1 hypothetical protein MWG59_36365 [Streptomyces sp. WAC00303]WIY81379.1 hypothetical protein QPM16_36015 [Streptomyces anulatus]